MKLTAYLTGIYPTHSPVEFAELIAICPAGDHQNYFSYSGLYEETTFEPLLAVLHANGWTRASRFNETSAQKQYKFYVTRNYEEADFIGVEYFTVNAPEMRICGAHRGSSGQLVIEILGYSVSGHLVVCMEGNVVVDNTIISAIIDNGLVGGVFNATEFDKGAARRKTQYSELTSEIVLPGLSATNVLYDPSFGRRSDYIKLIEEPFTSSEYHYPVNAFEPLEAFDFAVTKEKLGGSDRGTLVVSDRFRRLAKKLGARATWTPVRFD